MLSDLAKSGKTVIATLHQPSSQVYEMFDKILLLADGKTAFLGSPTDALSYFSNLGLERPELCNPADFLIELVDEPLTEESTDYRKIVVDHYKEGDYGTCGYPGKSPAIIPPAIQPKNKSKRFNSFPTSFWEQFYLLFKRGFKQHIMGALQQLFVFVVLSLLCTIVWWKRGYVESDVNDRVGLLFFLALNTFVLPIFDSTAVMNNEKLVVRKERSAGMYRLSSYFLSRSAAHLPLDLFVPVISACIVYWATNLNDKASKFFIYISLHFLGQGAAHSLGTTIGAAFERPETASLAIMLFFFVSVIMGGFFVSLEKVPVWFRWVRFMSMLKYLMDALLINEFDDEDHTFKVKQSIQSDSRFVTGKQILAKSNLIFDELWTYILVLVGITITFQIISYFILRRTTLRR